MSYAFTLGDLFCPYKRTETKNIQPSTLDIDHFKWRAQTVNVTRILRTKRAVA